MMLSTKIIMVIPLKDNERRYSIDSGNPMATTTDGFLIEHVNSMLPFMLSGTAGWYRTDSDAYRRRQTATYHKSLLTVHKMGTFI